MRISEIKVTIDYLEIIAEGIFLIKKKFLKSMGNAKSSQKIHNYNCLIIIFEFSQELYKSNPTFCPHCTTVCQLVFCATCTMVFHSGKLHRETLISPLKLVRTGLFWLKIVRKISSPTKNSSHITEIYLYFCHPKLSVHQFYSFSPNAIFFYALIREILNVGI